MAGKEKKNRKYGKTARKACMTAYNATQRWLKNAEKRAARQCKREQAQQRHVHLWAVQKLGYEPGDWDTSTSCREMRKIVRMSSNRKIGKKHSG